MTTTKESVHRAIAILKLPKPVGALITYAQGIVTRMTGNPAFGSPNPPLAVLTTAIGGLQTAETQTLARTRGAATVRNQKRAALVFLLDQGEGDNEGDGEHSSCDMWPPRWTP